MSPICKNRPALHLRVDEQRARRRTGGARGELGAHIERLPRGRPCRAPRPVKVAARRPARIDEQHRRAGVVCRRARAASARERRRHEAIARDQQIGRTRSVRQHVEFARLDALAEALRVCCGRRERERGRLDVERHDAGAAAAAARLHSPVPQPRSHTTPVRSISRASSPATSLPARSTSEAVVATPSFRHSRSNPPRIRRAVGRTVSRRTASRPDGVRTVSSASAAYDVASMGRDDRSQLASQRLRVPLSRERGAIFMLSPPPTPAMMEPSTSGGKRGKRGRRDDDALVVVVEKLPRAARLAVLPSAAQPAEAASPQPASPTPAEDAEPTLPSLGCRRAASCCSRRRARCAARLARLRVLAAPRGEARPPRRRRRRTHRSAAGEHGCDGWRWGTTDADARVVLLDPTRCCPRRRRQAVRPRADDPHRYVHALVFARPQRVRVARGVVVDGSVIY